MAIQFMDSFDFYGTTADMVLGRWLISNVVSLTTANKRTGTKSLSVGFSSTNYPTSSARVYLPTPRNEIGVAFGVRFPQFTPDSGITGVRFNGPSDAPMFKVTVEYNGSIGVYKHNGSSYVLIGTSAPVITINAWYHVEIRMLADNVVGEAQVVVNGVTVLWLTDMDLGTALISAVDFVSFGGGYPHNFTVDDVVIWDATGTDNNSLIGQVSVVTLMPNADTAAAGWAIVGTVAGYDAVDDIPPDYATSYLTANAVGIISEFAVANTPPEVNSIVGVSILALAQLSGPGIGGLTVSMVSGAAVHDGVEKALPFGWVYSETVHERDPLTDAAWTASGLDAALIRINKTT